MTPTLLSDWMHAFEGFSMIVPLIYRRTNLDLWRFAELEAAEHKVAGHVVDCSDVPCHKGNIGLCTG